MLYSFLDFAAFVDDIASGMHVNGKKVWCVLEIIITTGLFRVRQKWGIMYSLSMNCVLLLVKWQKYTKGWQCFFRDQSQNEGLSW